MPIEVVRVKTPKTVYNFIFNSNSCFFVPESVNASGATVVTRKYLFQKMLDQNLPNFHEKLYC